MLFAPSSYNLAESTRLRTLELFGVAGTPPESTYDEIARLAMTSLGTQQATVSVLDAEQVWYKGRCGLEEASVCLGQSLDPMVVAAGAPVILPDLEAHARTREHPAVRERGLLFYAGVPLISEEGIVLGALAVADAEPRPLDASEVETLQVLARQAMAHLELRRSREEISILLARGRAGRSRRHFIAEAVKNLREPGGQEGQCLENICQGLGLQLGSRAELEVEPGDPAETLPASPLVDFCSRARVERQAVVIADARRSSCPEARHLVALGLNALICFPLRAAGQHLGTLTLTAAHRTDWEEDELELVRTVGTQIAEALHRWRQEAAARTQAEALACSEERFRALVSHATVGIVQSDEEGRLLFVNDRFCELTGYTREELLELSLAQITALESQTLSSDLYRRLWREQRSFTMETRFLRKDGSHFWADNSVAPVLGGDGRPHSIVSVAVETTKRRKAEAALQEARDQAEAALRARDELLATLSHELRTPLTPVLLAATAWSEDPALPSQMRADLAMIVRNVSLEARMIDSLLDATRIARGKLHLQARPCEVHGLIHLALGMIREEAERKKVRLELELRAGSTEVQGDPDRLQQVIWNLLRNAIKFTPGGGRIMVRTGEQGGTFRLQVEDSGIGLAQEDLGEIFEPFKQAGRGVEHRVGGLGLGLTIARAIAEQHGGTLGAESAGPGQGACFTLMLKGARAPGPAPVVVNSSAGSAPALRPGLRLLVIEDHEPTLAVLTRLLRQSGAGVTGVSSVAAAVNAAQTESFDLVIADLGLPDGDGTEAWRRLRACQPQLRGIALSGYGMDEDHRRTIEAGFQAHLLKPVDMLLLRQTMHEVLREEPPRSPSAP